MLRLSILAIALLIASATSAGADAPGCTEVANFSAARLSWAALRKNHVDPGHSDENCRSYATNFFEAVAVRQAASFCKDGNERQRLLELLDFEIDAFNDLIATRCSQ
jgi:hypothetical protein